jgi:hypothetical protein
MIPKDEVAGAIQQLNDAQRAWIVGWRTDLPSLYMDGLRQLIIIDGLNHLTHFGIAVKARLELTCICRSHTDPNCPVHRVEPLIDRIIKVLDKFDNGDIGADQVPQYIRKIVRPSLADRVEAALPTELPTLQTEIVAALRAANV